MSHESTERTECLRDSVAGSAAPAPAPHAEACSGERTDHACAVDAADACEAASRALAEMPRAHDLPADHDASDDLGAVPELTSVAEEPAQDEGAAGSPADERAGEGTKTRVAEGAEARGDAAPTEHLKTQQTRTKALGSGMLRARREGLRQSEAEELAARAADRAREARSRRFVVVGAVCAAVALVLVAVGVACASLGTEKGPTSRDVAAVLEADADFMAGFAEDDYVTPTPYRLRDVEVAGEERGSDGMWDVSATATLENESFSSACEVELSFAPSQDAGQYPELFSGTPEAARDSAWVGVVDEASAETRAIAAVDHDEEIASDDFAPTFDARRQTCTLTVAKTTDLWFGASEEAQTYAYAFDGTRWQRRLAEDVVRSASFGELAGAYAGSEGDARAFTTFAVEDVDADAGTFTLVYERRATSLLGDNAVSGSIACSLKSAAATPSTEKYAQADGRVYTFAGTGTSSGGDGAATIEGTLTPNYGMSFTLEADYTKEPFLFGDAEPATLTVTGVVEK